MIDLTTTTILTGPSSVGQGLSGFEFVAAVASIVGGLVAVWGVLRAVSNRREDHALRDIVRARADQLDSIAEHLQIEQLRALTRNLQKQIDDELPREAHRIYLLNRVELLISSLGEQYDEYQQVTNELAKSGGASELQPAIRHSIERTVLPQYQARRRRDRRISVILISIVITLFLPSELRPASLFFGYLDTIYNAQQYGVLELLSSDLVAAGILAIPLIWILRLPALGALTGRAKRRPTRTALIGCTFLILALSALELSLNQRDLSVGTYDYTTDVAVLSMIGTSLLALAAWPIGLTARRFGSRLLSRQQVNSHY